MFEANDNYPNGPGWEGLVAYIMEKECPDIIDDFEVESEGDTFLANCDDEDKMIRLATLLQQIILDSKRLKAYLVELPDEYKYA